VTHIGTTFLAASARFTLSDLSKIEAALAHVSDDDVWRRPNVVTNSLGNLLLHLAGSHRFWIVSVVGRQLSTRQRHEEFDAREGAPKEALLADLRLAVADANDVLAGLEIESLGDMREAFGRRWTVLESIQHTVTHFSLHTGQIIQLVKILKGVDLNLPL
jgi:uncharacterized damage-inducible protein DinB